MPKFCEEHPREAAELLEQLIDADEARRHTDLTSRLRIARMMADGPLTDEAGA